ncbi:MAG: family 43 glycosylhydrolase, partial [Herpetosiphonaceae bacterium]|nr:family 43 glycosylhydrolase [Herpetosiphonaceae bacterium]
MLNVSSIRRQWSVIIALVVAAVLAVAPVNGSQAKTLQAGTTTFTNPLHMVAPGHGNGIVESCADPTVLHSQTPGDTYWYMYCTKDPLNGDDRDSSGNFIFHNISTHRSLDLVNWEYVGDAFATVPAPATSTAGLFAPEVIYRNNQYYLYFTVTDVAASVSGTADPNCNSDSAILGATSASPIGPWTVNTAPVIEPRYNGDPSKPFGQRDCNFFNDFDPDVITAEGQTYIYYGSYYGGIQLRPLSSDGFATDPATAVQITIPNRYEGAEVTHHNGYYYLYASATNCCNGPLTGYTVFAGRSTSPMGPFVDREGVGLTTGRVGGTPVLSMNGDQWVGPGHNTVFTDFAGKDWTIYHAVNRNDPYFTGSPGFTKRPALMDPIDYVNGFPAVRAGKWVSDTPISGPAAQPGEKSDYNPTYFKPDQPGALIPALSDSFNGNKLNMKQWTWVNNGTTALYNVSKGSFN